MRAFRHLIEHPDAGVGHLGVAYFLQLREEIFLHGDVRVQRPHDGAKLVNFTQKFLVERVEHRLERAEAAGHIGVQNGQ